MVYSGVTSSAAAPSPPAAHRVLSCGFAAVKGTTHVALGAVVLDAHGAVGDRELCVVDVAGRRVLKTVHHPALLGVVAERADDALRLVMPDGAVVGGPTPPTGERLTCDYWGRPAELELLDGPHAAALSTLLGRPVRLAAARRGVVIFGGEGITLVGTASLRDLGERAGHQGLVEQAARFRATFVVETRTPYEEEGWLGREVAVGDAVVRVGLGVPRCAIIDRHPGTGAKDGTLLRTLVGYRPRNGAGEPIFGVYARVVTPGVVTPG